VSEVSQNCLPSRRRVVVASCDFFLTGLFPDNWKISWIVPVPKKGTCHSVSDYPPINILPVLSEIFEISARVQVLRHVNDNIDPVSVRV
jgi:hypothetical protein